MTDMEYMELAVKKLMVGANKEWDTEAFKKSAYGKAFAKKMKQWCELENDEEACREYYRSLGVKRRLVDEGLYYERWALLWPEDMDREKKYPLVLMLHGAGSSLEYDEFLSGFGDICGREGFIALFPQNTNVDNCLRLIDELDREFPIDRERIYVAGHSHGGRQASSFVFEHPEKAAAFALNSLDVCRNGAADGSEYGDDAFARLKAAFVPCMQMAGSNEFSYILPLNRWIEAPMSPFGDSPEANGKFLGPERDSRRDTQEDPTRPRGIKRKKPRPPEHLTDEEKDIWSVGMINKRLDTLYIEPRQLEKCLSYRHEPDTELHGFLGFYGENERIEEHFGARHFMLDIYNCDGVDAFRYAGVENSPHSTCLSLGELAWDFFRQFRRDSESGKIVCDRYEK